MAIKTDMLFEELKAAETNLKNIQAQRDDLSQKICDFEFELSKLDLSDTSAAIEAVQSVTQSLEAHHAILERINNEIPIASNKVVIAQKKVNEAASESLRKDELAAYKDCIQNLTDLSGVLAKLDQIHKDLWGRYKAPARYTFSFGLIGGVYSTLDSVKHSNPELLGLPPKPTPEMIKRRELEISVNRMRERVELLDNYQKEYRSTSWENAYDEAKKDLKIAEVALKAL